MAPSFWRRFRALFPGDDMQTELVMFGNAFAALGIGVAALLKLDLSLSGGAAVALLTFFVLTGCLLFKATLWIPAALGGAAVTIGPTLLLAGVGLRLHAVGLWVGGALGLLLGLTFAFQAYTQVSKLARRTRTAPRI